METKVCSSCKKKKTISADPSISQFTKNQTMKDGFRSECKDCQKETRARSYQKAMRERPDAMRAKWRTARAKNPEAKRAATKRSYEKNRAHYKATDKAYRTNNRDRRLAHRAVDRAVDSGLLPPVSTLPCACPGCTSGANEYHHWSYAPADHLSVIPLCFSHHRLIHSGGIALEQPERYAIQPEGAL